VKIWFLYSDGNIEPGFDNRMPSAATGGPSFAPGAVKIPCRKFLANSGSGNRPP